MRGRLGGEGTGSTGMKFGPSNDPFHEHRGHKTRARLVPPVAATGLTRSEAGRKISPHPEMVIQCD